MKTTSVDQRLEIASAIGINPDYLYQIFTRRKVPSPELSLSIERETNGAITRQDLRPEDFWKIWPDLPAPTQAAQGA